MRFYATYLAQRLGQFLLVVFIGINLTYLITHLTPIDPVEQSIAETEEPEHRLKKNLGALDLTIFGVGVIIGAGIFVYTGLVAATNAGPAISLSFLIAGLACALAALCYAEIASMTSSGHCVPPGPSKNASGRCSAE